MTFVAPPAVLRLGSPAEMAAVIPHLLGFRPAESLVLASLSGPRRRIGLTVRLDLTDVSPDGIVNPGRVDGLVGQLLQRGEREVFAVVISRQVPAGDLPYRDLVARLIDSDLDVVDAVFCRGDRCWSYLCEDRLCCPVEGVLVGGADRGDRIAATFAVLGSAVLPDRHAVIAMVDPVIGPDAERAAAALRDARAWRRRTRVAARLPWAMAALDGWLAAYADPRTVIDLADAARLALVVQRVEARDAVIMRWAAELPPAAPDAVPAAGTGAGPGAGTGPGTDGAALAGPDSLLRRERAAAWRRLLLDVARRTLPPDDAPICTLFGCAAYVDGGGVLAEAALLRALRTDPRYPLARLVFGMLGEQVDPWRALAALQRVARS
jgi:hypothetical protein